MLGVGWPRAKRLVDLAGWSIPTTYAATANGNRADGPRPDKTEASQRIEIEPAGHDKTRTTP